MLQQSAQQSLRILANKVLQLIETHSKDFTVDQLYGYEPSLRDLVIENEAESHDGCDKESKLSADALMMAQETETREETDINFETK